MGEGSGGVVATTATESADSVSSTTKESVPPRECSHAAAAPAGDDAPERSGWGSHGPVAKLVNELIDALRPTPQSERRRRAVFQHIAKLVNGCFAGENVLVSALTRTKKNKISCLISNLPPGKRYLLPVLSASCLSCSDDRCCRDPSLLIHPIPSRKHCTYALFDHPPVVDRRGHPTTPQNTHREARSIDKIKGYEI